MDFKGLLLFPFRYLKPVPLNVPLRTIKVPPPSFCLFLILVSYFFITAGTVYCYVHGHGLLGMVRGPNGRIVPSWFDNQGLGSQFLAEGFMASTIYLLGALSFLAAIYSFTAENKRSNMCVLCSAFSLTCPIWGILSIMLFRVKVPSFFPALLV